MMGDSHEILGNGGGMPPGYKHESRTKYYSAHHSKGIEMRIYLTGIPMPISVNAAYENNTVPGQRGRRKTKAYREYEKAVEHWRLRHLILLAEAKRQISLLRPNHVLQMDYTFWFFRETVLTKLGRPKRNDTSNRLKCLEDQLAPILGVDDCMFWNGSYRKIAIYSGGTAREFVDVDISIEEISLI